jgi:hypothetical protein
LTTTAHDKSDERPDDLRTLEDQQAARRFTGARSVLEKPTYVAADQVASRRTLG